MFNVVLCVISVLISVVVRLVLWCEGVMYMLFS